MNTVPQSTIMQYLAGASALYFAKILELRETIQGWLSYIPQTFPHYTSHTIDHSEAIVQQLSHLLFSDDDHHRPVVELSAVEAYILIASAYLHDAGMVASDSEKQKILASPEWREWIACEGAGARWSAINALRTTPTLAEQSVLHFLADLQTRFLLAEWVRRRHHVRVADVIEQHHLALGRFSLGDPTLRTTIGDVCVAHGFDRSALEDARRYPDRRTIRGETVNVRFLALLLRIGDLLDLRHDRACPLLLNPASPLPSDSLAHWTQYQRIQHLLVAPDKIEIVAECENANEHRFLHDWCRWIVEELRNAGILMRRSQRHHDWQPPDAAMDGPSQTIDIRPSKNATYIPRDWRIELDPAEALERLIRDAYADKYIFVRELIQNALDAMRCRACDDILRDSGVMHDSPSEIDHASRAKYVLKIGVREELVNNELLGMSEERDVLWVDDCGIGMSEETIQRFLLQAGRSFYTTPEFRRSYKFVPTSRFGVGFLSVFSQSEHVVVETRSAATSQNTDAIRLTLTGPRQYILTERGARKSLGTRIEVLLKERLPRGALTKAVKRWCRRVEFAIELDDFGTVEIVEAEDPTQFECKVPDQSQADASFAIRVFPFAETGVKGEFYIFSRMLSEGESWAHWEWAKYVYPRSGPMARIPDLPLDAYCFHGINMLETSEMPEFRRGPMAVRVDFRRWEDRVVLARDRLISSGGAEDLKRWLAKIVQAHLESSPFAKGNDAWVYKQRLVHSFDLPEFWRAAPATIRAYESGRPEDVSLDQLGRTSVVGVLCRFRREPDVMRNANYAPPEFLRDVPYLSLTDREVDLLSDEHREELFAGRILTTIRTNSDDLLICEWTREQDCPAGREDRVIQTSGRRLFVAEFPDAHVFGARLHGLSYSSNCAFVLNKDHPVISWATTRKPSKPSPTRDEVDRWRRLAGLLLGAIEWERRTKELTEFLRSWRELDATCPVTTPESFAMWSQPYRGRVK